jgi:hypothetical protein
LEINKLLAPESLEKFRFSYPKEKKRLIILLT